MSENLTNEIANLIDSGRLVPIAKMPRELLNWAYECGADAAIKDERPAVIVGIVDGQDLLVITHKDGHNVSGVVVLPDTITEHPNLNARWREEISKAWKLIREDGRSASLLHKL